MKITPSLITTFETEIVGIIEDNWKNVAENLNWDLFMKQRPMSTKTQILVWLLTTAKLYPEGEGGNTRMDDLIAASTSYSAAHAGAGLRLTADEIEDNQINRKGNQPIGVLDYAAKWANDVSSAAVYWPQQSFLSLLQNGKTGVGYDGVPFFGTNHPLNPVIGASKGTYSNLISAVPINAVPTGTLPGALNYGDAIALSARNFAKALAAVSQAKFIGGTPRYLKAVTMLVPTALKYIALLLTQGDVLGQTSNVLKGYDITVVVDPNLDTEPDVYYLFAQDILANDMGAFIYGERKPFQLTTYSPIDEARLARMAKFEWLMKGRNTAVYGHPYLCYRCEPT